MKKIVLASVLALGVASPAFAADFSGPRIGANIGFADEDFGGTDIFTYGVNAGYDFDLGGAVAGATVEYQDSSEDPYGRDLSIVGRVGGKVGEDVLVYALAGYTNLGVEGTGVELDGARVGAGIEAGFASRFYGNVEYRYSNYELDAEGHQVLFGLGVRF